MRAARWLRIVREGSFIGLGGCKRGMNKQRLKRLLANLLVFLSTGLSSAWLFGRVVQKITSEAPSIEFEKATAVHNSRFQRLGKLPSDNSWSQLQFISQYEGWSPTQHTFGIRATVATLGTSSTPLSKRPRTTSILPTPI
jgi:hypothetical protein